MVRYLIIVARDQPGLYDYLKRNFAGDKKVEVLLDRRKGERRQQAKAHEPERRRAKRRQPGTGRDFRSRYAVIIRVSDEGVSG